MALLVTNSFPSVCPWTLAVGTIYTHASQFIVSRPAVGALYHKAQQSSKPAELLKSQEAATAAVTGVSSVASSVLQTYGVSSLLKLAGATSYKGASIVGTLLFAVSAGPQLVSAVVLQKQPLDVVLSQAVVQLLDTVGLALVVQWYRSSSSGPGGDALQKITPN